MILDLPKTDAESKGLCHMLVIFTSLSSFALGLVVLIGWWTHNLALVQILPHFPPMQYNTALGFFLTGLGLILFTRYPYISLISGLFVFALGALTLAEYIFNIHIGIDQLLMKQTIGNSVYPGRLPPNTALCFIFTGIPLILLQRSFAIKYQELLVNVFGVLIVMLGVVALLGYLAGIPTTYGWGNVTGMAAHTAVGFILIGIGICACAWNEGLMDKVNMHIYLPVVTIITGTLMFIILWQSLLHEEYRDVSKILNNEISDVQQKTDIALNAHVYSLALLQNTWRLRSTKPQPSWLRESNIDNQISNQYSAIAWLNKNMRLGWLANYSRSSPKALRQSIAACARNFKNTPATNQSRLLFGNNHIACVAVPLKLKGQTVSYIFGLINLNSLFNNILSANEAAGFGFTISGSKYQYYQSLFNISNEESKQWTNTIRINLLGSVLNLKIWPAKKILDREVSWYPLITLFAGFLITLLLAFVFRLWLITKKGKELVQGAKENLETEIKQRITTENKLRELKRRYSLILSSAGEGIYGIDARGKTTFVNPSAGRLLGWKPEELIGNDHHGLIHYQRKDKSPYPLEESPVTKTLKDGQVHQVSNEVFWRKNGEHIPVQYTCTPIIEDGEVTGAVVTFNDITERLEAEQQLKSYAQDLKDSNQELDDFAYIASHDLQEPLRGIHNFSSFLLEDNEKQLDQAGKEKLQTLMRLSKRLQSLLNDLLTYSKVGRLELAIGPCDLNIILNNTLDLLQSRLDEEGVEIRQANSLPTIICDNARIGEVFMNLISNALKYNDKPNKWIEIGSQIALDPMQPEAGPMQVIYIKDNGIGIKENNLNDVFTIFRRLHTQDKFGGGTGFGLTIAKKIIQRHNGHIWVESTFGQGTTFYLSFPQSLDSFNVAKEKVDATSKLETAEEVEI